MIEERRNTRPEILEKTALMALSKADRVGISSRAKRLLLVLLRENPRLKKIMNSSAVLEEAMEKLSGWALESLKKNKAALAYYEEEASGREVLGRLRWSDYAAIRILDYIHHAGRKVEDLNSRGEIIQIHPFRILWLAINHSIGGAHPNFFRDMIELFRQFNGRKVRELPSKEQVLQWMERHPSGLDPEIMAIRERNKSRIINIFLNKIESGEISDNKYFFEDGLSREERYGIMEEWWNDRLFHLRFAIRDVELLNEMLAFTLSHETVQVLKDAVETGIPIFVNPYYLSLLIVSEPGAPVGADLAIRDYVFNSKELVEEFGEIVAWEKEDIVEPGKPNAAGWLLPNSFNIHRRYPEVAILIPDTVGRACGGLCVSCQRMYDFQSGNLNFDLDRLKPQGSWWDRMGGLMKYFEEDSQLRDILITGGDALMSSDKSLKRILDAVYEMAERKSAANQDLGEGQKKAQMLRIRLGTRLPVYLPQRITTELCATLKEFKEKAQKVGFKQFVIQTHFETAMEITPDVKRAVDMLLDAGWIITNQQVFTAAASRRGHTAKLRKVLNDVGVLPYYTFTVKGYMENYHNFATNARAMQEQAEEKVIGSIPPEEDETIRHFANDASRMTGNIDDLRKKLDAPFLATDRNVLNLPGVGKSLTFRTIGITRRGRRILEFDHDHTRSHSPIINKMGKVVIVESKPVTELFRQLEDMGEILDDYDTLYGYSLGETEERMAIYEYPEYDYPVTKEITNLEI